MTRSKIEIGLVVAILLTACGGEGPTPPPPTGPAVSRIVIEAPELRGLPGWRIQLQVRAFDSVNVETDASGLRIQWLSLDTNRVVVDDSGQVTLRQFHGNAFVEGRDTLAGVADTATLFVARDGDVRWAIAPGGPMNVSGGPVIDRDGYVWGFVRIPQDTTIDIGDEYSDAFRVSPAGKIECRVRVPGTFEDVSVLGPNGLDLIIFGSTIQRLGPDCSIRQSRVIDVASLSASPVFLSGARSSSGRYYASTGFTLRALDSQFNDLWLSPVRMGRTWLQPPAISGDTVFAKGIADSLYAFDANTGQVLWTHPEPETGLDLPNWIHGVAVTADRVFLPDRFRFFAFDRAGTLLWQSANELGVTEPVVTADGRVFIQGQLALIAYGPAGNELWRDSRGGVRWWTWAGGPALAKGGAIYAAGMTGFFAFDLDGNRLWSVETEPGDSTWFAGSPAIGADGMIYTWSGTKLYSIFGAKPPDPTSPWPMWRHDAQRTGEFKP